MRRPAIGAAVIVTADPRERGKRFAFVIRYIPDIPGGVILDRRVLGFQRWNAQDMRPAKRMRRPT